MLSSTLGVLGRFLIFSATFNANMITSISFSSFGGRVSRVRAIVLPLVEAITYRMTVVTRKHNLLV